MLMMVVALLSWWYTTGWAQLVNRVGRQVSSVLENFSVGLLVRSLFDPYRQISAGQVRGGLDAQVRAWGDRAFSRVFGAVVRSLIVLIGSIAALFVAMVGWLQLIVWPFLPVLPVVGIILFAVGWTP